MWIPSLVQASDQGVKCFSLDSSVALDMLSYIERDIIDDVIRM